MAYRFTKPRVLLIWINYPIIILKSTLGQKIDTSVLEELILATLPL